MQASCHGMIILERLGYLQYRNHQCEPLMLPIMERPLVCHDSLGMGLLMHTLLFVTT